jgi:hypothetical protein
VRTPFLLAALVSTEACRSTEGVSADPAASGTATLLGMEKSIHGVGEIARARDYQMSVESVQECAMSRPFLPDKGKKVVGIDVALEGLGDREVPVNPFYATLVDAGGDEHATTLAGCTPSLRAMRVIKGQRTRGFLSFEVPTTVKKMTLVYAPTVIGAGREELRFDLDQ